MCLTILQELHPNFAVFPTYSVILRKCLGEYLICRMLVTDAHYLT